MRAALVLGVIGTAACVLARPAWAGKNDLDLLKLCDLHTPPPGTLNGQVLECSWVRRSAGGLIEAVAVPAAAEGDFRSLMSELAAVMAPRLLVPADNLGFGGFQVSGELAVTQISRDRSFWNASDGVARENPAVGRPDEWLSTAGAFVRKGLWLGLPAFEVGAGLTSLLQSNLLTWQGYAKLALHEGYHRQPFPSLAVRGAIGYLTGTDQLRMTTSSFDVVLSKRFGVMGTFRVEPYVGWSFLRVVAQSLLVDATPSCDAFRVRTTAAGAGAQPLGEFCADAQRGTANDEQANFKFPKQSPIRRQRVTGGAKLKFATVFLSAEYDLYPAGSSRDGMKANGARDGSGVQQSFALGAGFDY
jgi:hypothetical protein